MNWNGWKDTIECLESIYRISYQNFQVVVVDNGSSDDSVERIIEWTAGKTEVQLDPGNPLYSFSHPSFAKKIPYVELADNTSGESPIKKIDPRSTFPYPLILLRTGENLGFTGGNNTGLRKAIELGAEYALLLNNDTVVAPDFLNELVRIASSDIKIAIVGSVIADYKTQKIVFTNSKVDNKLKAAIRTDFRDYRGDSWETERICGAAFLLNLNAVKEHSLFLDDDLFLYCEEMELCLRARRLGLKVAAAARSRVYHKESVAVGGSLSSLGVYYNLRNRILLARKLLGTKQRILFWMLFVPARLLRCLRWMTNGRWRLIATSFVAIRDGIQGKVGQRKDLHPASVSQRKPGVSMNQTNT